MALPACEKAQNNEQAAAEPAANQATADEGRIACAPHGAADFGRECTLDRIDDRGRLVLVVHNPDGGFHRLAVTDDGRGVVAADGAEQASVAIVAPGTIEVAIGGDRYRLPARIKGAS